MFRVRSAAVGQIDVQHHTLQIEMANAHSLFQVLGSAPSCQPAGGRNDCSGNLKPRCYQLGHCNSVSEAAKSHVDLPVYHAHGWSKANQCEY